MIESFLGSFSNNLAVDLGTANILVYQEGKGIVSNEPSLVVIKEGGRDRETIAVGQEAKSMCCLLYTSPSPRDLSTSRMPSSA